MKSIYLTYLALVLWIVGAGWMFFYVVRGNVSGVSENRVIVELSPDEKVFVLQEMRIMLGTIHGITSGLRNHDHKAIVEAAKMSGTAMSADVNPSLMMKLPLDFKKNGLFVHSQFEEFANKVNDKTTDSEVISFLDDQLGRCAGCHAGYRIEASK
jgi:hypothetical protein